MALNDTVGLDGSYLTLEDVQSIHDAVEFIGAQINLLKPLATPGAILASIEQSCTDVVRLDGPKCTGERLDHRAKRRLVAGAALVLRAMDDVGYGHG